MATSGLERVPPTPVVSHLNSHDRFMTGKLCRLVGVITLIAGIGGPLLEIGMVGWVLAPRGHEPWTRRVMGQVYLGAFIQSVLSALMAWAFLSIGRFVNRGGMVSVWLAVFLAAAWCLLDCFVVLVATVFLVADSAALWQGFALVVLGMFHVQIVYRGIRTLVLASGGNLRAEPARVDPVLMEVRTSNIPAILRSRPVVMTVAVMLLLVNSGYAAFAWTQFRAFQSATLSPPALVIAPLPALPNPTPLFSATEPYQGDIYDPDHGMPAHHRQKVRDAALRLGGRAVNEDELDRLLREAGRRIVGDLPRDGSELEVKVEMKGSGRAKSLHRLHFSHGAMELPKGRGKAWADGYSGSFVEDQWEEDVGAPTGSRWGCAAIHREVDMAARTVSNASLLHLGAMQQFLANPNARPQGARLRVSVWNGPGDSVYMELYRRKYQITSDGKVWDGELAAVQSREREAAEARSALLMAEAEQAQQRLRHASESARASRRASAGLGWGFAPLALLADAALGVALSIATLILGGRDGGGRKAVMGLKVTGLVSLVLGAGVVGLMAYAWKAMEIAAPAISTGGIALLFLWRAGHCAMLANLKPSNLQESRI